MKISDTLQLRKKNSYLKNSIYENLIEICRQISAHRRTLVVASCTQIELFSNKTVSAPLTNVPRIRPVPVAGSEPYPVGRCWRVDLPSGAWVVATWPGCWSASVFRRTRVAAWLRWSGAGTCNFLVCTCPVIS